MTCRHARKMTTKQFVAEYSPSEYDSTPIASINTVLNLQKLQLLREIFPTVATDDVLVDVLVASDYQVDVAASMLGELVREPTATYQEQPTELVFVNVNTDEVEEMAVDDEDWSEVTAVRTIRANSTEDAAITTTVADAGDQWVVLQDEWEVVDMKGERVRSFADVLRSAGSKSVCPVMTNQLQQLSNPVIMKPQRSSLTSKKTKKLVTQDVEWSVKSFGARKRRFMKRR